MSERQFDERGRGDASTATSLLLFLFLSFVVTLFLFLGGGILATYIIYTLSVIVTTNFLAVMHEVTIFSNPVSVQD